MSANGNERPIFLDPSGRRARVVRLAGRALAGLAAAWLAAMLLALGPAAALPGLAVPQRASAQPPPVSATESPVASRTRSLRWPRLTAGRHSAERGAVVAASVSG
jgi:hypothetical protein